MFILHLVLGGCLKAPPISFGITADTGGHLAYVMGAAAAQAAFSQVSMISIVTRLFEDAHLGPEYAQTAERIDAKVIIHRIATSCRDYVEKEALIDDLPAFTDAMCNHLAALQRLPDVIHAHFADAAAVAIEVKARFGVPFVYTPHALGIDKRKQQGGSSALDLRIELERRAIASADAIIVSSCDEAENQVKAYSANSGLRVHCLPPGVPQHRAGEGFSKVIAQFDAWLDDAAKPIVFAIARPVRKKNLAALVRAYAHNADLAAATNLVILAGLHDGYHVSAEEREVVGELYRLCVASNLHGRIVLPASHDAADVAALYRRAAAGGVFVNPALHEPFGLTLIEAAAAGVPVVATQHGGPAEIVASLGHGLLIDPHDDAAISEACLRIVTDAALHARLAAAAQHNMHLYSWSNYATRSVAIYNSLRRQPRLLACDIDNALTGSPAGTSAFSIWRTKRRLPFVVATGRSFDATHAILDRWQLPQPEACIVDVGMRLMLPMANGRWQECPVYASRLAEDGDRVAVAAALASLDLMPQPFVDSGPYKLNFFGLVWEADVIRAALAATGLAARVIHSHEPLIDILAPRGGKAAAIAAYAERYGMALADCIATGNSGSGLDMIEACGHAITLGNADADLSHEPHRNGLFRVTGRYVDGVMEGLAAIGIGAARE